MNKQYSTEMYDIGTIWILMINLGYQPVVLLKHIQFIAFTCFFVYDKHARQFMSSKLMEIWYAI